MTPAALVPASRRFSQSPRRLPRRGRPVTSAGLRPRMRVAARGGDAAAPDPRHAQRRCLRLCAAARAWHVVVAGTRCRRSSASSRRSAQACTNTGTRSTDDATSSWAPSSESVRSVPPPRVLHAAIAARRSRRVGGSPIRRGVDLSQAAAKVPSRTRGWSEDHLDSSTVPHRAGVSRWGPHSVGCTNQVLRSGRRDSTRSQPGSAARSWGCVRASGATQECYPTRQQHPSRRSQEPPIALRRHASLEATSVEAAVTARPDVRFRRISGATFGWRFGSSRPSRRAP